MRSYTARNTPYDPSGSAPLEFNNCGFYENLTKELSLDRPNGRVDFHILFAAKGEMTVDNAPLPAGNVFIYLPGEPQKYTYPKGEGTLFFWLHFAGEELYSLFRELHLSHGMFDVSSCKGEVEELLRLILTAYTDDLTYSATYASGITRALLALIAAPRANDAPMHRAVRLLKNSDMSIHEIAETYNMSVGHFSRIFKEYLGRSPLSFRTLHRMQRAKELLLHSDLSIERIANSVGYTDPLYFSRAFHAHVGLSPRAFRKSKDLNVEYVK